MKCTAPVLCLLAATVAAAGSVEGPVSKVVTLLEDLRTKIETDGESDEKDFKEHECWCDKVQTSKQDMIKKSEAQVEEKTVEIQEAEAQDHTLEQEIEKSTEEITTNTKSQDTAEGVRTKEHTANQEDITENTKLMDEIEKAATKLSGEPVDFKHAKGTKADSLLQYSPKAQSIQGILQTQYEKTDQEVNQVTKEETATAESFKGWMTDMKEQLGLLEEEKTQEEKEEAEVEVEIAEDTEMKEDSVAQAKADTAFLAQAEASCAARRAEYLNRTALRNEEMEGVNKAMGILESKRELLSQTFKDVQIPSFLQLDSNSSSHAFTSAIAALDAMAAKAHSLRLAVLAARLQEAKAMPEGAFTTVLKEIDDMKAKLKAEAESDKKKKDHCRSEYHTIQKKTKSLAFLVQKSTAEVQKLSDRLAQLAEEKEAAEAELAETDADVNKSSDLRAAEHQEFKKAKADDELAISVLKETSDSLSKYYDDRAQAATSGSLVQYDPNELSDERAKLRNSENKYTLSDDNSQKPAAEAILALLGHLTGNLQKEIADGQKDEENSQLAYEEATSLLLAGKEKLTKKITSIAGMISNGEGSKADVETSKGSAEGDMKAQEDYKASIQGECNYLLEKFDERVANRESEMDGLARARELLSGSALVQQAAIVQKPEEEDKTSLMNYLGFA